MHCRAIQTGNKSTRQELAPALYYIDMFYLLLVCRLKLLEEAYVILGEHTEVLHLILKVSDALDTHAEGIARVNLAVDAIELEYVGVDHTATEDLYPASTLTEGASLTSTDVAADVHLGRRFGEGEV